MNQQVSDLADKSGLVSKSPLENQLIAKVEPVVESLGFGLRDLEFQSRSSTLCIMIEGINESPIGIEDCQKVHEVLGPLFDVWDPLSGNYTLEISSPGESPSLRLAKHFQSAIGSQIRFNTLEALPVPEPAKPRKNWQGLLQSFNEDSGTITILDDKKEFVIPLKQVKSAQLCREWTLSKPKER